MRIHELKIGYRALQRGQFLRVVRRRPVVGEDRSRSREQPGNQSEQRKGPEFHRTPLELAKNIPLPRVVCQCQNRTVKSTEKSLLRD